MEHLHTVIALFQERVFLSFKYLNHPYFDENLNRIKYQVAVGRSEKKLPLFFPLFVPQVEVIGGADKYQAACRKCYGGLMAEKENSAPLRHETPQQVLTGKLADSGISRKLFSSLHL